MKKHYWYILLTYVIMLFSGYFGYPLLLQLGVDRSQVIGYWNIISFAIGVIVVLLLLRKDRGDYDLRGKPASPASSAAWAIGGIFLAFLAQVIAANIESQLLGIKPGSENTKQIMDIVKVTPLMIFVVSIAGPVLEEIVFRKIIFGTIYKRTNFILAALISSVIFAVVHRDPAHILLYSAMGFTFAFLYVKTKRIIVPIIAHLSMNTIVVVIQYVYSDDIERMMKDAEQLQSIIGGNFL
ncbi:CPBP family intramembrane metalloprotease [Bacillus sp. FJAT-42376]|uniref:CPBP family intramembrane glutamic endopeptidase n=1 Tax=Bacillus sp. FJAT-42376 TaxID=2014076 RepID=UPI000F4DFB71|nr:type II CAAX endopeptidase family protein [Bacillus sp. FJAT-42376]AZB44719.1 CPBP family intramembrane metalloprotease [Bacillus sp. FJAT-42376]